MTQLGGIITSSQVMAIQLSGLAPFQPLEAVILAELQPGSYTALLMGFNNSAGLA